jgi:sugar phosphate isomerase/epimerase
MRLAAFTTFTPEHTFPEACALLKAIGFAGVQPRVVPRAQNAFDPAKALNPWSNNRGGIDEEAFVADPRAALAPARAAGLEITSIASYAGVADLPRAVALAKACGAAGIRHIRIGALGLPSERLGDWPALRDRSRAAYRELVAEAKKIGVRPCIELHAGTPFPSPSGLMAFLEPFSPDEVGVLYDPGNGIYEGWEPPRLALSLIGAYLAEVHVKNSRWVADGRDPRGYAKWKAEACAIDEGCVDWGVVVDELKARGFTGWLIEEGHHHGVTAEQRLRGAHALLTKLLS